MLHFWLVVITFRFVWLVCGLICFYSYFDLLCACWLSVFLCVAYWFVVCCLCVCVCCVV